MLSSLAVVLEKPERMALVRLPLDAPAAGDVVVETLWSGISAGTERLLFTGRMPPFPGMGYPLVPGYEMRRNGRGGGLGGRDRTSARGSSCRARDASGRARTAWRLGFASRRTGVTRRSGRRSRSATRPCCSRWPRRRSHALGGSAASDGVLIVGHGVLGRLLARLAVGSGGKPPVVWEKNSDRARGAVGYEVTSPEEDRRRRLPHDF